MPRQALLIHSSKPPKAIHIYKHIACATRRLKLSCLVQNQTAFSASHVQADWAHLDHVVYKNEVIEREIWQEAMAKKQPLIVLSNVCQFRKKGKDSPKRCFSLAVDTVGHLKV